MAKNVFPYAQLNNKTTFYAFRALTNNRSGRGYLKVG